MLRVDQQILAGCHVPMRLYGNVIFNSVHGAEYQEAVSRRARFDSLSRNNIGHGLSEGPEITQLLIRHCLKLTGD